MPRSKPANPGVMDHSSLFIVRWYLTLGIGEIPRKNQVVHRYFDIVEGVQALEPESLGLAFLTSLSCMSSSVTQEQLQQATLIQLFQGLQMVFVSSGGREMFTPSERGGFSPVF